MKRFLLTLVFSVLTLVALSPLLLPAGPVCCERKASGPSGCTVTAAGTCSLPNGR